ncbi:hypothetical protein LC593_23495 [Nostoc sp. CHAB 5844]|nr:hypothetical protein [Nostoc sp. CHAB 5844]
MSEVQIQEIYRRLSTLETEVNSLKAQVGGIGTSQAAIAQIYTRLDRFAEVTNSNLAQVTERFDRVEGKLDEILRILRDRNGGTGI